MKNFRERNQKILLENIYQGLGADACYMAYCRTRRRSLSLASFILMIIVLLYAYHNHYSPYALTAIISAFFAGSLSGYSANYVIAMRQWPFLKRLLDKQAVEEAYNASRL